MGSSLGELSPRKALQAQAAVALMSAAASVGIDSVSLSFSGVKALREVSLSVAEGSGGCHRAQRRGEDLTLQLHLRGLSASGRCPLRGTSSWGTSA